jgi:hypothetical protein
MPDRDYCEIRKVDNMIMMVLSNNNITYGSVRFSVSGSDFQLEMVGDMIMIYTGKRRRTLA